MRTLSLAALPSSILFPSAPCAGTDLQNTPQTHPLKPVRVLAPPHTPVLIHRSRSRFNSGPSPGSGRRFRAGMAPKGGTLFPSRERCGGAVPAPGRPYLRRCRPGPALPIPGAVPIPIPIPGNGAGRGGGGPRWRRELGLCWPRPVLASPAVLVWISVPGP